MSADFIAQVALANSRGPTSGFTDVTDDGFQLPANFDRTGAAIFKPLKVGDLNLSHRVFHAALGRSRSANHTESPLAAKYFSQRTTPGSLIISQATTIAPEWSPWPWSAGLYNDQQIKALQHTIDTVHARGGFWFHQLFHVGRSSSPSLVKRAHQAAGLPEPSYGYLPVSSSAVAESGINTHSGEPFGTPHALTVDEIKRIRTQFKQAAQTAKNVGADGIEASLCARILAGNGFLLDQFLHDNINRRDDEYGGSVENRSRIVLEIVDDIASVFGYQRIGVRISPFSNFHETDGSQPLEQLLNLSRELALRGVAYLHVGEGRVSRNIGIAENLERLRLKGIAADDISLRRFRELLDTTSPSDPRFTPTVLVGNGGYTSLSGILTIEERLADAVSFGRYFISNPDLVDRLRKGYPLATYDRSTFYTHAAKGYISYPTYEVSIAAANATADAGASLHHEAAAASPSIQDAPAPRRRVAIIGAGVSGIVTAAAFEQAGGFDIEILERRSVPGGIWVYNPTERSTPKIPGTDPNVVDPPLARPDTGSTNDSTSASTGSSLPFTVPRSQHRRFVASPLYESLEANIPYRVMTGGTVLELKPSVHDPDAPFLSGLEVAEGVRKLAHGYDRLIRYRTAVEDVTKRADGGLRLLLRHENKDGTTETWSEEDYDHLVVATGHNTVPRVPHIPGLDEWRGGKRHTVDWRSGEEFRGQRILIVGSSESAIDVAIESKAHGAREPVYVSQRTPHPRYPTVFVENGIDVVATISHLQADAVHLTDGTVLTDVDAIVFATGYMYSYPFLSEHVRPRQPDNGYYVPGLFAHIFDIHNPQTIAFVGVANGSLAWLTWQKSAFLVALLWSGKIRLPPKADQLRWAAGRLAQTGERHFHILATQAERVLYWDEINQLAVDYLHRDTSDDALLRSFPFEWVVELFTSRTAKLRRYGIKNLQDIAVTAAG